MLLAVVAATPALASNHAKVVTYRGSILVAHVEPLVTWQGAACDPRSPLNGIDGVWFKVPPGATGSVTLTPGDALDAQVLPYALVRGGATGPSALDNSLDCGRTDTYGSVPMQSGFGQPVSGQLPAGTEFVLINGFYGTGAFTLQFRLAGR
jgi:hypothetical protein